MRWEPSFYGPRWRGFDGAAESLERRGLLISETLRSRLGSTMRKFSVTPEGRLRFQGLTGSGAGDSPERRPALSRLRERFASSQESDLARLLREHRQKPLASLLDFVYEQYPEYCRADAD